MGERDGARAGPIAAVADTHDDAVVGQRGRSAVGDGPEMLRRPATSQKPTWGRSAELPF